MKKLIAIDFKNKCLKNNPKHDAVFRYACLMEEYKERVHQYTMEEIERQVAIAGYILNFYQAFGPKEEFECCLYFYNFLVKQKERIKCQNQTKTLQLKIA